MRRGMITTAVAAAAAASLLVTVAPSATAAKNGYTDYHVGNAKDIVATMKGGTLLSGGGIDDPTAMRWLLGRGGGTSKVKVDVVVLDAWGKDIYSQPFLDWGADSVDTYVITARAGADDPAVVDAINKAEVIWFDGGDQSKYIDLLTNTKAQTAINDRVRAGAAFGGMSAGLAIQGGWIYSAYNGSATSSAVLANPYDKDVTLSGQLFDLPGMANVVTDTHFEARDRMGRLLGFLGRLETSMGAVKPRAIAVDEDTSLGLDPSTGTLQVFGVGTGAWLLRTDNVDRSAMVVQEKQPLTYGPVSVTRLNTGDTFTLSTWKGSGTETYAISAVNGVVSPGNPY